MHNNVDGKNCVGITYPECVFETFPCDHYLAGAGLVSTLKDYSNFAKMLLNKGKSDGNKVLSEKTLKLLSTPYVQKGMSPSCESWGLGVRVITDGKYPYLPVGSFGWSGAYGTHFWIDSKNDIFAVFMRNSRYDGGSGSKASLRFEKAVWDALE